MQLYLSNMTNRAGSARAVLQGGGFRFSPPVRAVLAALLLCASFFLASCGLPQPQSAHAAVWPVASSRLSPSLGFHDTYSAGSPERSYVHSGLDAPASAGSQISAPIAGRISFTGSVPSGDSSLDGGGPGETMRAVSIKMDDGRTLTLMPFADVAVERGEQVAEGRVLGTLAASGDRSSSAPHVHVGLKKGSTYYDPMTLFGVSGAATGATLKDASPAGASAQVPSAVSAAATEPAQGVEPSAAQLGTVPDAAALPQAAGEDAFGTVTSGDASWTPVREGAGTPLDVLAGALETLGVACDMQVQGLVSGLQDLARGTGVPVATLALALVLAAVAGFGVPLYAAARWALPRIRDLRKAGISALVPSKREC